ncbi:hypothetical protein BD410DRAFT_787795 [Rickenella mellea]|uniref:Uncharacterized protein n=1 Tax=Rickenella mellea TaxID=50990 RepID=A0A4Y7Q771_9AGAM|nr:hypothetical protein BD410DRAFT_787795 [Rickenella mellea]
MKLSSVAFLFLLIASTNAAQVTYDSTYDKSSNSLAIVAVRTVPTASSQKASPPLAPSPTSPSSAAPNPSNRGTAQTAAHVGI